MARKLGALPRDHSKPAPALEAYLTADPLPEPPSRVDRVSEVSQWPVYMNDRLGCCTVASVLHSIGAWTAYSGRVAGGAMFSDAEVVKIYSAVSGYDPDTGENDNGATLQSVCEYMTKTGAVDTEGRVHKFAAWAEINDVHNTTLLKRILNAFDTVYLAIDCPESAIDQSSQGEPWTVVEGSPIAGGHAIPLQYSAAGEADGETIITWGIEQKLDNAFEHRYVSEAVAIVSADDVNAKTGKNVAGLNLQQLIRDCQTKYLV